MPSGYCHQTKQNKTTSKCLLDGRGGWTGHSRQGEWIRKTTCGRKEAFSSASSIPEISHGLCTGVEYSCPPPHAHHPVCFFSSLKSQLNYASEGGLSWLPHLLHRPIMYQILQEHYVPHLQGMKAIILHIFNVSLPKYNQSSMRKRPSQVFISPLSSLFSQHLTQS